MEIKSKITKGNQQTYFVDISAQNCSELMRKAISENIEKQTGYKVELVEMKPFFACNGAFVYLTEASVLEKDN